MNKAVGLLGTLVLAGCATVIEGPVQTITVESAPPGAACAVSREREALGTVVTPGAITLDKSKNDLVVTCSKPGYRSSTLVASPKYLAATFGNLLVGGLIGFGVDAATAANFYYPPHLYPALDSFSGRSGLMPAIPVGDTPGYRGL